MRLFVRVRARACTVFGCWFVNVVGFLDVGTMACSSCVHSPGPAGTFLAAWDALVAFKAAGKARSIGNDKQLCTLFRLSISSKGLCVRAGVSNFGVPQLDALAAHSPVVPSVNQVRPLAGSCT